MGRDRIRSRAGRALIAFLGPSLGASQASAQELPSPDALFDVAVDALPYIAGAVAALLLLAAARRIANWVGGLVRRNLEARNFDPTLTRFFASLARTSVLVLSVLMTLSIFGIETTSFAALIGAFALAIGLSFQGTLGNFAAGVMLLVFRPLRVGQMVEVAGEIGRVEAIDLMTTEIQHLEGHIVILPNSEIFGNKIVNYSEKPTRRVSVPVGVDYGADIDDTRRVLLAGAADIPGTLDEPAPQAYLVDLGNSSVDWELRVYCKSEDYFEVRQATVRAAKRSLDAAGITIPFPQLDLHLDEEAYGSEAAPRRDSGIAKAMG